VLQLAASGLLNRSLKLAVIFMNISPTVVAEPALRRRLFLVSFLILFLELSCIRWFGSTVIFLTFFTNIILMACFLGMSVGLLSVGGRYNFTRWALPILCLAIALASVTLGLYESYSHISVDVGNQASPQQVFFGTEYRANDPSKIVVPLELIAGTFFVLIALVFVGLGQIMGRAFDAIPDRIRAYTADIAGSIAGIAIFGICSYLQTPPLLWFVISLGVFGWLWWEEKKVLVEPGAVSEPASESAHSKKSLQSAWQLAAAFGVLLLVGLPGNRGRNAQETYWSPYYKITYWPAPDYAVNTNNIGHQEMHQISEEASAYSLPHLLNRDAGKKPFMDVLIIGAGSGNDVQAARSFGASSIDAVEIDPVIQSLGKRDHPDQPYADPRVRVHFDDGRSFVKKTNRKYDLIIYALVDSLVLHSGYSSLRLESFLFTRQAMQDVKSKLKPNGVFAMYNFYRQGWVVQRLVRLGGEVFERKPLVLSLPYRASIQPEHSHLADYTFILCGQTQDIENAFTKNKFFWINSIPTLNLNRNGYGLNQPPPIPAAQVPAGKQALWSRIGPAQIDVSQTTLLPDDNWPFLYLRERAIPALNQRGILMIGVLSFLMLWLIGVRGASREDSASSEESTPLGWKALNWQMFFLGAGFMLLETKSIVHMALLFGSTWIVNSFVFGTILLMILASNLWVAWKRPTRLMPYYALLLATLLLGLLIPMNSFLALPGTLKVLASCAIAFIPVFFAGVVFSISFRDSKRPATDFGCNVAGIILGGLCEFFSLIIGFNGLLGLAMILYALSFAVKSRSSRVVS